MNRKWLYGAAIVAVIALTSVSVSRIVSDRASITEVVSVDLDVDKDTRVKTSKISEQELQTIQDEIWKTYEKQAVIFSIGLDTRRQQVMIEANFTEVTKEELLRKYGEAVDITLYDPGAIAEDQNNGSFANIPEPVQQIGGPNDKVYWPPYEQNYFLNDDRSKALGDEVYAKTGFARFSGSLLDKYGLYVKREGEDLPKGALLFGINRLPVGMKTRISLTELEPYPSLQPIREISQDTFDKPHGMRVDFPDHLNTIYALNLELLNEAGETIDGKVTVYAFEADEVNARMEADRQIYKPSDNMKIKITNWGPTSLEYGSWFAVQQWVSGEWRWLNGYQAFTLEARGIGPGGEVEDSVHIQGLGLEPGRYRIVKTFGGGTQCVALAAPFEVVAG